DRSLGSRADAFATLRVDAAVVSSGIWGVAGCRGIPARLRGRVGLDLVPGREGAGRSRPSASRRPRAAALRRATRLWGPLLRAGDALAPLHARLPDAGCGDGQVAERAGLD